MDGPQSLKRAHEDIQKKIFVMLPEKWDRLYLYASIIDHFNDLQTGEMFFFYYPKGVLKKRPVNVYEVPAKFNIDERQYFALANELYASIKKLRKECIAYKEKPWSNMTISIEKQKYKVEYYYEDLATSTYSPKDRHLIWGYKYLHTPYESFNKKEREIIDEYEKSEKQPTKTYELPLYTREVSKEIDIMRQSEKNLKFVTEEKIEEMEFIRTYEPKSQILNSK